MARDGRSLCGRSGREEALTRCESSALGWRRINYSCDCSAGGFLEGLRVPSTRIPWTLLCKQLIKRAIGAETTRAEEERELRASRWDDAIWLQGTRVQFCNNEVQVERLDGFLLHFVSKEAFRKHL
uniref:Uncharacterized protein n=1 Tax=Steinernema glaseri TaxID=37863 RepID=A0A1I8A673_9BILA